MRARLERSYRFEAAHFLPKVPPGHKCARMHGHSYQIEVAIEGEIDPERGWVVDFAAIDEHAAPLVRALDHQILNEIDGLANPTSELLAAWWWQRLAPTLPGLVEIVVSETPTSRCVLSAGSRPPPAATVADAGASTRTSGARSAGRSRGR